jgi:hypothetical protein
MRVARQQGGPARQREKGGGGAQLGWLAGTNGRGGNGLRPSFPFSFSSSFGLKFKYATNSNITISSICIKQRQNLGFNMMQHFILPWNFPTRV